MADNTLEVPTPELPFWMDGKASRTLCRAAQTFFQLLGEAAIWPARQCNPMECTPDVLDIIAWQRCVARYPGEPERLYRLRVAHAYANARDAGQTAGWGRIFQRLELGGVALRERVPGQDWDRVGIAINDDAFSDQQNVLEIIIEDYGRTCRRYYFDSRIPLPLWGAAGAFDEHHETLAAARDERAFAGLSAGAAAFGGQYETFAAARDEGVLAGIAQDAAAFGHHTELQEVHA